MCDEQFDVSPKLKKLFDEKQKQRAAAKEYYLNFLYNPHRPVNDGVPFDPALHRFSAMSAYHADNFKPSGRHWAQFLLYLSPFALTYFWLRTSKRRREELLRSGQVSYSDREYKLIF